MVMIMTMILIIIMHQSHLDYPIHQSYYDDIIDDVTMIWRQDSDMNIFNLEVNICILLLFWSFFCFCTLYLYFVYHPSFWLKRCQQIALCRLMKSLLHCCCRLYPQLSTLFPCKLKTFLVTISTYMTQSEHIWTHLNPPFYAHIIPSE